MRRIVCLSILLLLASISARATDFTIPYAINNTAYTDLGAGPLMVQSNSAQSAIIFIVADSQPLPTDTGHVITFNGGLPYTFMTTGHVYARIQQPYIKLNVIVTPVIGSGSSNNLVIPRVVASGSAQLQPSDYLVLLTGTASGVTLEAQPQNGETHIIKDGRGVGSPPIQIASAGGDPIEGQGFYVMGQPRESVTVNFTTDQGWVVY